MAYWPESRCSIGIFKPYMDFFKRMKIANSFEDTPTHDNITSYIHKFTEQNVDLDYDEVSHSNAGMRTVAKLCSNSLWGKYGQKSNRTTVKFARNEAEFWNIRGDPSKRELVSAPIPASGK